jgi:hypothetical protein
MPTNNSGTFQTNRPTVDMKAASVVQQGVRNQGAEAFAGVIEKLGSAAFEGKIQYDIGKAEGQAETIIDSFIGQDAEIAAIEQQQVNLIDQYERDSGAPNLVRVDEADKFKEFQQELTALQAAKSSRKMSKAELTTRVEGLMKEASKVMPGRRADFIRAGNALLGTNQHNINFEAARQQVQAASIVDQAKAQEKVYADTATLVRSIGGQLQDPVSGRLYTTNKEIVEANSQRIFDHQTGVSITAAVANDAAMQKQTLSSPTGQRSAFALYTNKLNARYKAIDSSLPIAEQEAQRIEAYNDVRNEFSSAYSGALGTPIAENILDSLERLDTGFAGAQNMGTQSTYLSNKTSALASEFSLAVMQGAAGPVAKTLALLDRGGFSPSFVDFYSSGANPADMFAFGASFGNDYSPVPPGGGTEAQKKLMGVYLDQLALALKASGLESVNSEDTVDLAYLLSKTMERWTGNSLANDNKIIDLLSEKDSSFIVDQISPEAKDNFDVQVSNLINDKIVNGLSQIYDPEVMEIRVTATGIQVESLLPRGDEISKQARAVTRNLNHALTAQANLRGVKPEQLYNEVFAVLQDSATIYQASMAQSLLEGKQKAIANNITFVAGQKKARADMRAAASNFFKPNPARAARMADLGTRQDRQDALATPLNEQRAGRIEQQRTEGRFTPELLNVPSNKKPTLAVGIEYLGYRFKGGDGGDSSNWEKI